MNYYIITFGCQMNKSDSERIAASLEKRGYKPAAKETEADLVLVNMCSIRQSAVDRVFGASRKLAELKTQRAKLSLPLKTILTGCILKSDRKKFAKKFDLIVSKEKYLASPFKSLGNPRAYIPISNGCNNFCTYCVVPFTRGALICRDHRKILKEAKNAVKNGSKEIWLLGQNVNDYQDKCENTNQNQKIINFAKLIESIDKIPGDFKFFFMSPHPNNFSDELIKTMANCRKYGHYLNLPVQSGDNLILRKMNRSYTVQQYKALVRKIRQAMPDINLSTDIIVGFPGETKKQFENTIKLFKRMNFDMAYISKFSSRPGTAIARIKDSVALQEKEKRWKILNDILLKNWKTSRKNRKLIALVGPTASGKSAMAVKLALRLGSEQIKKRFRINGAEIISADSRQVYKGMDIGAGKITKKEMRGIPHYLLNIVSPRTKFSAALYRNLALKKIDKTFKKNKIPIICGGAGFYIQAAVDGIVIPEVKPDWKLRKKLDKMTAEKLFNKLKKIDPERAKKIDGKNKRRLIRAVEIVIKTGKPVPHPLPHLRQGFGEKTHPVLMLGIKKKKKELKKLINKRLLKRLKQGMIKEVEKLRKSGVSWKRLEEFGLEYRFVAQYLQKKITLHDMINLLKKEIEHYAKRQMTWFKKDSRINWIKDYKEAEKLVKKFLEKK